MQMIVLCDACSARGLLGGRYIQVSTLYRIIVEIMTEQHLVEWCHIISEYHHSILLMNHDSIVCVCTHSVHEPSYKWRFLCPHEWAANAIIAAVIPLPHVAVNGRDNAFRSRKSIPAFSNIDSNSCSGFNVTIPTTNKQTNKQHLIYTSLCYAYVHMRMICDDTWHMAHTYTAHIWTHTRVWYGIMVARAANINMVYQMVHQW